jgi:hypothetical protein
MGRSVRLAGILALGVVFASATVASAAPPPPTTIEDQNEQRKALYQSELEHNLQLRTQAEKAEQQRTRAAVQLSRSMERNFVPAPDTSGDLAAPLPASVVPAVPESGVGVVGGLLLGLVGGMVGGCAALVGWVATTRRRLRQPASAT